MKTITLNKDGYSQIFGVLAIEGIISIDKNGDLHGKAGISKKPRWTGGWTGLNWTNSEIKLSDKGISMLKEIAVLDESNTEVIEYKQDFR